MDIKFSTFAREKSCHTDHFHPIYTAKIFN